MGNSVRLPKFLFHPLTTALAILWVAILVVGIAASDSILAIVIGILASALMLLAFGWLSKARHIGVALPLVGLTGPLPAGELAPTLESVPAPLFALDGDRLVVAANASANRLFGGAILGRNLLGFMRHPPFLEALEAIEREDQPEPVELPDSQGRGEPRTLVARLQAIRPPIGRATVMVLIEDATAAERALTLRRDFVANVSHEMKTPIAALLGFIETLQGPAKDDAAVRQRFLGIMRGEAERMNRLVSELLSLSRIEMNEHQPPAGRAALGSILQTVNDSLSMKAGQRGVELSFPPLVNLPEIPGDADELLQAVQNLVDNAIKYGGPQSEVTVACQRIDDPMAVRERLIGSRGAQAMVALSVTDQGDGIAREHIPRLTERFYRVDAARSRELGGTGLGLAIVKHIVNRHRGSLEILSEPGQGSTFTLYLPAE
jgi:two-component system phosphate regulon sensor histidine kinase PhoR